MKNIIYLDLYTRPTCSDCQDAKAYLEKNSIDFTGKNVAEDIHLEQEMRAISGNRIVPLFAFYKKNRLGKRKLIKHFIGFENNKAEIVELLNSKMKTK